MINPRFFLWLVFMAVTTAVGAQNTVAVFDKILFYDGYAQKVNYPVPNGIVRINNATYSKKIDFSVPKNSGLELNITINPACDNYDRIGSLTLVFLPKGTIDSGQRGLQRLELARFITPFMDKNKNAKGVNYVYNLNHLAGIFRNDELRNKYDYWLEFDLFGVSSAAQKQIKGCDGKIETFYGSASFSFMPIKKDTKSVTHILACRDSLNNYQSTDTLGKSVRSFAFQLKKGGKAKLNLIISNHGANKGGEEYIRREHFVYVDDKFICSFIPGGISCEPYRELNTQRNGIYGKKPKTEQEWTSWNNWCPGAAVPLRIIDLPKLKKGQHRVTIAVPSAKFVDKQGFVLVSGYVQAF